MLFISMVRIGIIVCFVSGYAHGFNYYPLSLSLSLSLCLSLSLLQSTECIDCTLCWIHHWNVAEGHLNKGDEGKQS